MPCKIFDSLFSNALEFLNFISLISIRQSIASGISFILCYLVLLEFLILYFPDISPDRQQSLDSTCFDPGPCAWDGKEAARVGEGEEGGLVGGAEPGDPSLAGGAVLPMKLRVYRLGICLLVSVQLLL